MVRGAPPCLDGGRAGQGDTPADGRVGEGVRQLGRVRHGLLALLREDAVRVREGRRVDLLAARVREAGELRADGVPGRSRRASAGRTVPRVRAPHREGRARRAELREEGRALGAATDREPQSRAGEGLSRHRPPPRRFERAVLSLGGQGSTAGTREDEAADGRSALIESSPWRAQLRGGRARGRWRSSPAPPWASEWTSPTASRGTGTTSS